jgi:hypothetical protein
MGASVETWESHRRLTVWLTSAQLPFVHTSNLKRQTDAMDVPRPHQRRRQNTRTVHDDNDLYSPREACSMEMDKKK